jgi:hypothetical protein
VSKHVSQGGCEIQQKVNQHTVIVHRLQEHHTEYWIVGNYTEFKTLRPKRQKPLNKRLGEKKLKSNYCSKLKSATKEITYIIQRRRILMLVE